MSEPDLLALAGDKLPRRFGIDSFKAMFPRASTVVVRHEAVVVTQRTSDGESARKTVRVPILAWVISRGNGEEVLAMVEPNALDRRVLVTAAGDIGATPVAATVSPCGYSVQFQDARSPLNEEEAR